MDKPLLARTIALALAGAALIVGAAIAAGSWQIATIARQNAARALARTHTLQVHFDEERRLRLEHETNALATNTLALAEFVDALHLDAEGHATPDVTTLRNRLESRRTQAGFDTVALLDPAGPTIASAGDGFLYRRDFARLGAVTQVRRGAPLASGMLDADGRIYGICVAALARSSGTAALLLAARRIDESAFQGVAALAMTQQALVTFAPAGAQLAASTLRSDEAQPLLALANSERALWQARAANPAQKPFALDLAGKRWYAQFEPLRLPAQTSLRLALVPPASFEPLLAAIVPPLAAAAGFGIALLWLMLAVYWLRTVRPLAELDRLAHRARGGDYVLHGAEKGSPLARRTVRNVNALLAELARHRVPPGSPRRRATDFH